ncbi:MAG TPA: hypothetical protein VH298_08995, partial [Jatrophihabitans sp.]|nr:hypothetical protein [Jatrophihabitans sp.]
MKLTVTWLPDTVIEPSTITTVAGQLLAADDEAESVAVAVFVVTTVTWGWAGTAAEPFGAAELESSACAVAMPTKKVNVPAAAVAAIARATRAPGRRRV